MTLDPLVQALIACREDGPALHRVARDLGHELPFRRLDLLQRFLAELAARKPTDGDAYVRGFRAAIADIVRAYVTEIRPQVKAEKAEQSVVAAMQTEDAKAFERFQALLLAIHQQGVTRLTELRDALDKDSSVISKAIKQATEHQLVEPVSLEGADGRSKYVQLTDRGRQIAERWMAERPVQTTKPMPQPQQRPIKATARVTTRAAHDQIERQISDLEVKISHLKAEVAAAKKAHPAAQTAGKATSAKQTTTPQKGTFKTQRPGPHQKPTNRTGR